MSNATMRDKLIKQAEDLTKASNQIQTLTAQNIQLKEALIDKHVNEIRRIEAFKILNTLMGNGEYFKCFVKNNFEHTVIVNTAITFADVMIERLKDTAKPFEQSNEPDAEAKDE